MDHLPGHLEETKYLRIRRPVKLIDLPPEILKLILVDALITPSSLTAYEPWTAPRAELRELCSVCRCFDNHLAPLLFGSVNMGRNDNPNHRWWKGFLTATAAMQHCRRLSWTDSKLLPGASRHTFAAFLNALPNIEWLDIHGQTYTWTRAVSNFFPGSLEDLPKFSNVTTLSLHYADINVFNWLVVSFPSLLRLDVKHNMEVRNAHLLLTRQGTSLLKGVHIGQLVANPAALQLLLGWPNKLKALTLLEVQEENGWGADRGRVHKAIQQQQPALKFLATPKELKWEPKSSVPRHLTPMLELEVLYLLDDRVLELARPSPTGILSPQLRKIVIAECPGSKGASLKDAPATIVKFMCGLIADAEQTRVLDDSHHAVLEYRKSFQQASVLTREQVWDVFCGSFKRAMATMRVEIEVRELAADGWMAGVVDTAARELKYVQ